MIVHSPLAWGRGHNAAGALCLRPSMAAIRRCQLYLGNDTGTMHMAAAVCTPTLALFGASPRRIWAPPVPSVHVIEPLEPCLLCEQNRFRNAACLLPVHQCMLSITPVRLMEHLEPLLGS